MDSTFYGSYNFHNSSALYSLNLRWQDSVQALLHLGYFLKGKSSVVSEI